MTTVTIKGDGLTKNMVCIFNQTRSTRRSPWQRHVQGTEDALKRRFASLVSADNIIRDYCSSNENTVLKITPTVNLLVERLSFLANFPEGIFFFSFFLFKNMSVL